MTIKELKQRIENLPDNMQVFVGERMTEFTYGLVNSAHVLNISFSEEPGWNPLAKEEVFILTED